MITKEELKRRVDARKEELDAETDKLATFREKIAAFIDGIKSRSVIYNLVKNLQKKKNWKRPLKTPH